MGSDQDSRRGDGGRSFLETNTFLFEGGNHLRVVNELAQNGDRARRRVLTGQRDGIAHPKTHAEMVGAQDLADDPLTAGSCRFLIRYTLHDKVYDHTNGTMFNVKSNKSLFPAKQMRSAPRKLHSHSVFNGRMGVVAGDLEIFERVVEDGGGLAFDDEFGQRTRGTG